MKEVICCVCGIQFSVPDRYITERKLDHKTFYCPNGHSLIYPQKSDVDKLEELKEEVERLEKKIKSEIKENGKPNVISILNRMNEKYIRPI